MKRKSLLISVVIVTFLIIISGCNKEASTDNDDVDDKEKVTLKLSSFLPDTSAAQLHIIDPWIEEVEELTEGKVEFEVYPAEQLGKADQALNLTKDGVADISVITSNYFPDQMPLTNMLSSLPNLNESAEQGSQAYQSLLENNQDLVETDFERNGVVPLVHVVSPPYAIWSTKEETRVPDDLKGVKIRSGGGAMNDMFEFIGASSISMSSAELYEATEKGVVDAVALMNTTLESSGIDEIIKFGTEVPVGRTVTGLVINQKTWEGLSDEVQDAMIEANESGVVSSGKKYDELIIEFDEKFEEQGGNLANLSDEEYQKWIDVFDEFNDEWIKKHSPGEYPYEEVLDEYVEYMEEYNN